MNLNIMINERMYKFMENTKVLKICKLDKADYTVYLTSEKETVKFIKRIEMIVRGSQEYKDYITFLKEYVDMTKCAFFNNVNNESRKVRIEIHHEPITLFDIVRVILNKWIAEGIPLNDLLIADEVMGVHFYNHVGLIPLSKTVHELCHGGSIVIPLYLVYGKYKEFLREYESYIDDELYQKIETKIALTRGIDSHSFDKLKVQYEYIDVDGYNLPQKSDTV